MILFHAAYRAVRRALGSGGRREAGRPVSVARLVGGEFGHLIRRLPASIAVRLAVVATGALTAVEVGLYATTPGPTIGAWWRRGATGVAAAILLCCWALHVSRSTSERGADRVGPSRPPPGHHEACGGG